MPRAWEQAVEPASLGVVTVRGLVIAVVAVMAIMVRVIAAGMAGGVLARRRRAGGVRFSWGLAGGERW